MTAGNDRRRRIARTRSRCLGVAGDDLDARLERAQADGRITVGDADEVRRFGAYLEAAAGKDDAARGQLYVEHYPEDFPERESPR